MPLRYSLQHCVESDIYEHTEFEEENKAKKEAEEKNEAEKEKKEAEKEKKE